ncbi:hypothetical protein Daus18300_003831 [Diaporthe australafricana]|uniref:Uncharacterized protein n=1 Tax=Diaporthe australafricana TaxID=127596 RepID=A0ABR3XE56_9PEZI
MVGIADGQSQDWVRGSSWTQSGVAHEWQMLLVNVTVGQPSWEIDEDVDADDVSVAVRPDSEAVVVGWVDEVDDGLGVVFAHFWLHVGIWAKTHATVSAAKIWPDSFIVNAS